MNYFVESLSENQSRFRLGTFNLVFVCLFFAGVVVLQVVEFPRSICRAEAADAPAVIKGLNGGLDGTFPWAEYPVRLGWVPNTQQCWIQLLSRDQQRLAMVSIELAEFSQGTAPTPAAYSTLVEENTPIYVTVTDILTFLHSAEGGTLSFVWASEVTGTRHLQLISKKSGEPSVRTTLTAGPDWEVKDTRIVYDSEMNRVFFAASKESPLETHYYSLQLEEGFACTQEPQLLTTAGSTHSVHISPSGKYLLDSSSSLTTPLTTSLWDLAARKRGATLYQGEDIKEYAPPDQFSFTSKSGFEHHGIVYKATTAGSDPVPTIVFVYGDQRPCVCACMVASELRVEPLMIGAMMVCVRVCACVVAPTPEARASTPKNPT